MKLINEDKYGAYIGTRPAFLENFILLENTPNFDVYDSKDGSNRFIAARCSRMPDDEDPAKGIYGINFHRAKPDLQDALKFRNEFPASLWSQKNIHHLAFAAVNESDYQSKSAVWEKFYSYIWGKSPQTVWATPHSGIAGRKPDADFPYPRLEMDGFVSGVAARCAYHNKQAVKKRIMASIHSHNWHGAIFDLGGFGIINVKGLTAIAAEIENKYHDKAQDYAAACLQESQDRTMGWLKHIHDLRGSLNPPGLAPVNLTDSIIVRNVIRGLQLYGIEITRFTFDEFEAAFANLRHKEIQVVSCNHIFAAELIGAQLDLKGKISRGEMNTALQIECMKFYLHKAPDLMSSMLLDIVKELGKL